MYGDSNCGFSTRGTIHIRPRYIEVYERSHTPVAIQYISRTNCVTTELLSSWNKIFDQMNLPTWTCIYICISICIYVFLYMYMYMYISIYLQLVMILEMILHNRLECNLVMFRRITFQTVINYKRVYSLKER